MLSELYDLSVPWFSHLNMGIVVDMGNSNEHPLKKENVHEDDHFLHQSGQRGQNSILIQTL